MNLAGMPEYASTCRRGWYLVGAMGACLISVVAQQFVYPFPVSPPGWGFRIAVVGATGLAGVLALATLVNGRAEAKNNLALVGASSAMGVLTSCASITAVGYLFRGDAKDSTGMGALGFPLLASLQVVLCIDISRAWLACLLSQGREDQGHGGPA